MEGRCEGWFPVPALSGRPPAWQAVTVPDGDLDSAPRPAGASGFRAADGRASVGAERAWGAGKPRLRPASARRLPLSAVLLACTALLLMSMVLGIAVGSVPLSPQA